MLTTWTSVVVLVTVNVCSQAVLSRYGVTKYEVRIGNWI
jgi:hypothetical protein